MGNPFGFFQRSPHQAKSLSYCQSGREWDRFPAAPVRRFGHPNQGINVTDWKQAAPKTRQDFRGQAAGQTG